jgi:hypothetical protein
MVPSSTQNVKDKGLTEALFKIIKIVLKNVNAKKTIYAYDVVKNQEE